MKVGWLESVGTLSLLARLATLVWMLYTLGQGHPRVAACGSIPACRHRLVALWGSTKAFLCRQRE